MSDKPTKRQNQGKPPLSNVMYMPDALAALSGVLEYGEKKYTPASDRGWLSYDKEEVLQSLFRHLQLHMSGEVVDPATMLTHMASVMANAGFYIELMAKGNPHIRGYYRPVDPSDPFQVDPSRVQVQSFQASWVEGVKKP